LENIQKKSHIEKQMKNPKLLNPVSNKNNYKLSLTQYLGHISPENRRRGRFCRIKGLKGNRRGVLRGCGGRGGGRL
jgi:hypothetical protein